MKRSSSSFWGQFVALALVALMSLTNVAMAVGQMNADATGEMTLCIGSGHITVQIDSEGQPVKSKTICPDCVVAVSFTGVQSTGLPPVAEDFSTPAFHIGLDIPARAAVSPSHPARAPPVAR